MHRVASRYVRLQRVIDHQRVHFWARPTNADRMPPVVVHVNLALVPNRHRPVSHVKNVVNVPVHEFNANEVAFPAAVEEQNAIRLQCLETEIDVHSLESFQHGESDVGVFGLKGCHLIRVPRWRIDEPSC